MPKLLEFSGPGGPILIQAPTTGDETAHGQEVSVGPDDIVSITCRLPMARGAVERTRGRARFFP